MAVDPAAANALVLSQRYPESLEPHSLGSFNERPRDASQLGLIPGLQPRTVDATEPRTVEISVPLATGEHIV